MSKSNPKSNIIVHLSTYPPRECGIATFTRDLTASFDERFNPVTSSKIVALNESQLNFYHYPERVIDAIPANSLESYVDLAEKINAEDEIKLVNIQHEFGIYGGEWGGYLIPFLQVVKKPVVVTFHSVLPSPDENLKRIVQFIGSRSKALLVMNSRSRNVLVDRYDIPRYKIFFIPHGIPHVTFEPSREAKQELNLSGKIVLTTFGMLSPNKGIEYALRALPKVVRRFPNLVYIILGETHPVVRRVDGEGYRNFLQEEVERLNLKHHVLFYNKYLTIEEIVKYLKATDVYLSTVTDANQSVSGTLSYALGCGRAVVATPTEYAKHIVNESNGILVEFRNHRFVADALLKILSDEKLLRSLQRSAYETTRHMTWPNVAAAYFRIYRKFADLSPEERKLPILKLNHLFKLTDDFGILHHARYSEPERRFGYSADDNARALLVAAKCYLIDFKQELIELMKVYLKFLRFTQRPSGAFANIVNSSHKKDKTAEEDTQGRVIWALGFVAAKEGLPEAIRSEAERMLKRVLPLVPRFTFPRAIAFTMTGLYHFLKGRNDRRLKRLFIKLAERELKFYSKNASPDWHWFEDHLSYSNSKLSECLYYAYDITRKRPYLEAAEATLKFLSSVTFEGGRYVPIGQNGWYFRHQRRAYFDQQPEDAAAMVEAKLTAYRIEGREDHLNDAYTAFQWFLGKNHLHQMVYNEVTGGCHDGVDKYAINLNQGAESTISYLLARLAFEKIS